MGNLKYFYKYTCLKFSFKTSPLGSVPTPPLDVIETLELPQLLTSPPRDADLLAQELYLTMLSMAAMMKNIKMGSRRMYWDRVRHPVSEKHELSGQKVESEMGHPENKTPSIKKQSPLGLTAHKHLCSQD